MPRSSFRTALVVPAFLVGISSPSQDRAPRAVTNSPPSSETISLRPMIVTATRHHEQDLDLPFVITQIDARRLRSELMAASLPEALQESPGVLVQQTAHGQGSPFLRGFTGFRTLALVDGVRLNNSTFRDGPNQYWSTIDILAVDQIEVVRGPGSVMYGSDAIGGVVNALMRSPAAGDGPGIRWNGLASYRFGSAERAHLGRVEGGAARAEQWGFTVGVSGKTFGDLDGGREVGRQPQTGYTQGDFDAKLRYDVGPGTRLILAHQLTDQYDVERTHRTIHGITWKGLRSGTDRRHSFDQSRRLTYARLEHETERGDEFTATVSWHIQDEFQYVERADRSRQESTVDVDTLGFSVQGVSPSALGTWTYGVEHYHDFVDSAQRNYGAAGGPATQAVQGPVADDADYDNLGVFVQDEIPLGQRLALTLGGRFNWARADAGRVRDPVTGAPTSLEDDWAHVVGSGRLRWFPTPDEDWSLFGGASQGFRAPNLSDLTRFDVARSGELETAAPDLKPEKYLTLEIGTKLDRRSWEAGLAYYHTFVEDMIVRTPTGAILDGSREVTKRNASEGWIHGVEFNGRLFLPSGFSLFAQGAWQEGESDSFPTSTVVAVRAPVSRMHPAMGLAGLRWDSERRTFFGEVFGLAALRQDRLSPDDRRDTQRIPPGGTPGWSTLNLRAGYSWNDRAQAVFVIENLLDEDYRIHGSGLNQPGRNFKLSLGYSF